MVETWISREAFEKDEYFKEMIASMPELDLNAMMKLKSEQLKNKIGKIQGKEMPTQTEVLKWKAPEYNDDVWAKMNVPGVWEQQGLEDLDGFAWLRKSIQVSASEATQPAVLELAMIDEKDETYINGQLVGRS